MMVLVCLALAVATASATSFPLAGCTPGNLGSASMGSKTSGLTCTPYTVALESVVNSTFTYTVSTKAVNTTTCAKFAKAKACTAMDLIDIKFGINKNCSGAVSQISIKDATEVYSRSPSYSKADDKKQPKAAVFKIIFPKAYTVADVESGLQVSFTLNTAVCSASKFFNTGAVTSGAQYAYYSSDRKCCGTDLASYA